VALDHITFQMPDYRKEAAFYIALMGWKLRSDDGKQAVLDIGEWGSAIFRQAPGQRSAVVESFCFVIEPWNAATVAAELRRRGLTPVAENDGKGFESFHVKDADGWDLQISNGNGLAKARKTPANATLSAAAPFEATGWKTVWLDHLSFGAANYKESASFYTNLLGWKETYDEGSQHELLIGEVGDIIIRGGNPNDPNFGKGGRRGGRIDHISYGISPWDTDRVKAELEKRGLRARIDTSTRDDIHVAAFKSYHTTTPNGYDLQISYVTHENRLALPNAVKPKPTSGR
jgi:catechol 2,3-dioxygenase-like lactoylglutathione lyase family enzyme